MLNTIQSIILPFFVTTFFFYIEAVIHYNIGKHGKILFKLPTYKHNLKIISTILIFSFLSCCITHYLKIFIDQLLLSLNSDTQNAFHSHNLQLF